MIKSSPSQVRLKGCSSNQGFTRESLPWAASGAWMPKDPSLGLKPFSTSPWLSSCLTFLTYSWASGKWPTTTLSHPRTRSRRPPSHACPPPPLSTKPGSPICISPTQALFLPSALQELHCFLNQRPLLTRLTSATPTWSHQKSVLDIWIGTSLCSPAYLFLGSLKRHHSRPFSEPTHNLAPKAYPTHI